MINSSKCIYKFRQLMLLISRHWNFFGDIVELRSRLRPTQVGTISAIAFALGVSRLNSKLIYIKSLFAFVTFGQKYADRCSYGFEKVIAETKQISIEGEHYVEAALSTGRPLLITTIHMGDFQLGFLRLMERFRPARKTFLFKLNAGDQKEAALMKAFQHVMAAPTVLRVNEAGGKSAYLALRQSHIVAMAVDVEVQVKSRSIVRFFGRPCYMQNGPATIAALSKALVLPVVTFKHSKGHTVVRVEPAIDSDASTLGEAISQRIDRVTQQLAKCMQQWLINTPSQAHFWTSIAATMSHPLPRTNHTIGECQEGTN